jgi:hypothetical protein
MNVWSATPLSMRVRDSWFACGDEDPFILVRSRARLFVFKEDPVTTCRKILRWRQCLEVGDYKLVVVV